MFANIAFIDGERKLDEGRDDQEFDPDDEGLQRTEAGEAHGEIAHAGRPAEMQQQPVGEQGHQEIPEDEPVATFEVGVAASASGGGNLREVGVGSGFGIEVGGWLRFGRNGDDGGHLVGGVFGLGLREE